MGTDSHHLSYRQRQILYAATTEYIASGEPVSSRALAKRYGLNLSAATIRNVLSDLEEMGFLYQPHTSAGRMPSDLGLRVFVDALMHVEEIPEANQVALAERLQLLRADREAFMRESGKLLASMTGGAAVLRPPRPEEEALMQLRFLDLSGNRLLAVLVTRSGLVQNRFITLAQKLSSSELEQINNFLDQNVKGKTLLEMRNKIADEKEHEQGVYRALSDQAMTILEAALGEPSAKPELLIEGQEALIDHPEFADTDKLRSLLRTLEEKERIIELLDRTLEATGVQVVIGAETQLDSPAGISVICTNYGSPANAGGSVGVIAPRRADYGKIVPLVDYTARIMGEILDKPPPED